MRSPQIIVLPITRVDDVLVNPAIEICNYGRASDLDTLIRRCANRPIVRE
jgi:hypothetical protein